ncbi:MAG: FUN14 domain-containing protein [Planctomycetota bacterium]|nr:FUN14 domain-containing protein [Planctomycetota bacterium]
MDDSKPTQISRPARSFGGWLREKPRWKKVAVLAATAALVTGAVMTILSPEAAAPAATSDAGQSGLAANLVPDGPRPGAGEPPATAAEPAAKGVFRLGFSFLAGFCLGAFVRAAMKVVSIAFGFWLAMTLALSYFGLVVVDWQAIDAVWTRFCANVESEWGNFQSFLTGSLPAAGLAFTGLAIGLKRH